jgi:hypothetical protein
MGRDLGALGTAPNFEVQHGAVLGGKLLIGRHGVAHLSTNSSRSPHFPLVKSDKNELFAEIDNYMNTGTCESRLEISTVSVASSLVMRFRTSLPSQQKDSSKTKSSRFIYRLCRGTLR